MVWNSYLLSLCLQNNNLSAIFYTSFYWIEDDQLPTIQNFKHLNPPVLSQVLQFTTISEVHHDSYNAYLP